jgi:Cof subfamily protein (haloacid dehalogenase superfamily)
MGNSLRYRVLALDLDDTLLRSDRTISPRTLELLRCWRAQGGQLVIATGRPPRSIAEALPPDLHDAPWIAYNGAQIYEAGTKTYENLISVEDTQRILTILLEALPTSMLGLEIDNTLFLNQESNRPSPYQLAANLLAAATAPSAKVLFYHQEFATLGPLLAELPPTARALLSDKYRLVQILAATADKAEALRHWVAGQGLEMAQVVAFGDDVNDVEMVRQAGLGVAVANAVPEVKAVARRITLSNDEDGVAHVLAELLG